MSGFGCLRAEGENRPSRPNHVVVRDGVKCLNPWDVQSKRQYEIDGAYRTLDAGQAVGGQAHGVCYAMEGNTVDRESRKNGYGYCEGVCPTLNTQDRHAICYGIDQQGGKGNASYQTNVMPTLCSDSHGTPHAVCFQQNQREEVRNMGEKAGAVTAESGMHNTNYVCQRSGQPEVVCAMASSCVNAEITDGSISPTLMARAGTGGNQLPLLCLNDQGGQMMDVSDRAGCLRAQEHGHQPVVCYGVDCRNGVIEEEKSHTIQAHNNGGFSVNCTPNVLFRNDGYGNFVEGTGTLKAHGGDAGGGRNASSLSIYSVENHSNDSRVTIRDDEKCQTLTSRMGTGGNNVPMILEIMDE